MESFWRIFFDVKVASYYYQFYSVRSRRLKTVVSIICTLASSASIVSWYQSGRLHTLWAILIFLSQLAAVLQPFFPYEKQYHAACYIYEDLTELATDAERVWYSLTPDTSPEKINNHIQHFHEEMNRIESRFATADTFPQNMRLYKQAEENATIYFRRFE